MHIRNAARALIVQNGHLLVIKFCENQNEWFLVPGGGQDHGESLEQTVRRECREEINVEVEVKELVFIREYIGKNHGFKKHVDAHQVEFFFLCNITSGQPSPGHIPDTHQVGIEWLKLSELESVNFYPHAMRSILSSTLSAETPPQHSVYLGDIN